MRFSSYYFSIIAILSGCASGYESFYTSEIDKSGSHVILMAQSGTPEILTSSGSADADIRKMFEDGYARIGYSSFLGKAESESNLVGHARKVGAHRVVVIQKYKDSQSGAIPIVSTRPVTTYSTGVANTYGAYGGVSGTYSGASTTYVPTTTYIPYNYDRYEQTAMFFSRMKPPCLGAMEGELTDFERQSVGSNRAVKIAAVSRGSPLYNADVLPGDIVVSFNGDRNVSDAAKVVGSSQDIQMEVWRDGKAIMISLTSGDCSARG